MNFCTSIHCMDGRIQEPIIKYLKHNYNVNYVDTITEPGPCRILSQDKDERSIGSIHDRIKISINKHGSRLIAVSGHHDCAGNPCDNQLHQRQIKESTEYLKRNYPKIEIIGLWVNQDWEVKAV